MADVLALHGSPGAGKSTLARALALRLRCRDPSVPFGGMGGGVLVVGVAGGYGDDQVVGGVVGGIHIMSFNGTAAARLCQAGRLPTSTAARDAVRLT